MDRKKGLEVRDAQFQDDLNVPAENSSTADDPDIVEVMFYNGNTEKRKPSLLTTKNRIKEGKKNSLLTEVIAKSPPATNSEGPEHKSEVSPPTNSTANSSE